MKKIFLFFLSFVALGNADISFAFTDKISTSVAYLQEKGAFSNEEESKAFDADAKATREMLIAWVMRMHGISENVASDAKSSLFTDVKTGSFLTSYADIAQAIGAFDGWSISQKLVPHKKITTLEALSFLFSVENVSIIEALQDLPEANVSDFPKDIRSQAILLTAIERKIIEKNAENNIFPAHRLSKGELGEVLAKFYKSQKAKSKPLPVISSDYDTIKTLLQKNYLYNETVNIDEVNDNAFEAMLKTLNDPYSVYMPPEESDNFTNYINDTNQKGNSYAGIGASVQEAEEGGVVIVELFDNSPAYIAGIRVGDVMISADGNDITNIPLDEAINFIKGLENTVVQIEVLRNEERLSFAVVRKKIVVENFETVTATTRDSVVWIKVRGFKTTSADEIRSLLDTNVKNDTKGIIIDLRYNPGGLLESAQEILGNFLPAHSIASRLLEHGSETKYETFGDNKYSNTPVVIFQNKYPASASEIFAASIKDYARGKIVGTVSFGKGVAQNLFFLDRGSVKLTTAEFVSPLGNTINHVGVKPDVEMSAQDDESYFLEAKKIFSK